MANTSHVCNTLCRRGLSVVTHTFSSTSAQPSSTRVALNRRDDKQKSQDLGRVISFCERFSRKYTKMPHIKLCPTSSSVDAPGYKSSEMFKQIQEALDQDGASIVKKMKGVFCFKVKGADGKVVRWIVDVKNGNGAVKVNSEDKADTTITMADQDLYNLMLGKLNPQNAFFQGKLKIEGNMGLAMKLKEIQPRSGAKL